MGTSVSTDKIDLGRLEYLDPASDLIPQNISSDDIFMCGLRELASHSDEQIVDLMASTFKEIDSAVSSEKARLMCREVAKNFQPIRSPMAGDLEMLCGQIASGSTDKRPVFPLQSWLALEENFKKLVALDSQNKFFAGNWREFYDPLAALLKENNLNPEEASSFIRVYVEGKKVTDPSVIFQSLLLGVYLTIAHGELSNLAKLNKPFLQELDEFTRLTLNDLKEGKVIFGAADGSLLKSVERSNAEGIYDPKSDRIMLYSQQNAAGYYSPSAVDTLLHEAFHRWQDFKKTRMTELDAQFQAFAAGAVLSKLLFPQDDPEIFMMNKADPHDPFYSPNIDWHLTLDKLAKLLIGINNDNEETASLWEKCREKTRQGLMRAEFNEAISYELKLRPKRQKRLKNRLIKEETELLDPNRSSTGKRKKDLRHNYRSLYYLAALSIDYGRTHSRTEFNEFVKTTVIPKLDTLNLPELVDFKANGFKK